MWPSKLRRSANLWNICHQKATVMLCEGQLAHRKAQRTPKSNTQQTLSYILGSLPHQTQIIFLCWKMLVPLNHFSLNTEGNPKVHHQGLELTNVKLLKSSTRRYLFIEVVNYGDPLADVHLNIEFYLQTAINGLTQINTPKLDNQLCDVLLLFLA